MNLVFFIFASYGLTTILVWGKIFNKIRPKHEFFHCSQCVGYHSGWIMYLMFYFGGIKLIENPYFGWFICGCLSAGTSYALDMLFGDEGINIKIIKNK